MLMRMWRQQMCVESRDELWFYRVASGMFNSIRKNLLQRIVTYLWFVTACVYEASPFITAGCGFLVHRAHCVDHYISIQQWANRALVQEMGSLIFTWKWHRLYTRFSYTLGKQRTSELIPPHGQTVCLNTVEKHPCQERVTLHSLEFSCQCFALKHILPFIL